MGLKDRYHNQTQQTTKQRKPTVSFDDDITDTTIAISKVARAGMTYLRERLGCENYSETILYLVDHFKQHDRRGKNE
jgi:hypothetical protein